MDELGMDLNDPETDEVSFFGTLDVNKDSNAESSTSNAESASGGASAKADLSNKGLTLDGNDANQILEKAKGKDGVGVDAPVNLGSSSAFPMYYPLDQGRNHPLAMTSMASCPPYASAATQAPSPAGCIALESSGLQSLLSQQQQHRQQAQQQLALATSFKAATDPHSNVPSNNNANGNNITASSLTYNSPYSTHLSELTANFRNNPNVSVHYGMAVNGFHPQVNAQINHVFPLSNNAGGIKSVSATAQQTGNNSSGTNNSRKHTRGGRGNTAAAAAVSTHTRNSRERNNREQIRAQKITQLISELRENIKNGGWEKEMKSKYQTLSECKEYVQHLVRYHKEKEADIAHTRKLVEEKVLSEARSGNLSDSVTSSLTAFTTRSTSPGSDSKESSSLSSECQEHKHTKKRKEEECEAEDEGNANMEDVPDSKPSKKRRRSLNRKQEIQAAQQQHQSSTDSSCEDDEDDDSPGGRNISFDKTCSSVSDMTDSNKSCTTNNHTKCSTGSISSTAAVVRGVGSSQHSPCHHRRRSQSPRRETGSHNMGETKEEDKVMVEDNGRKFPHKKRKKKERDFDYDYREVFFHSSVPQLIATLSGRIVVWNDFFHQATGLNKRDIGRLTIFSIVQSDQLSTLYKMVARALAKQHVAPNASSFESTSASGTSCKENNIFPKNSKDVDDTEDWQAVTLKCVRFPLSRNEEEEHQLYLTITLQGDANRDQRCFHCTLTDTPSDKGQYCTLSPKLLSKMFTPAMSDSNISLK